VSRLLETSGLSRSFGGLRAVAGLSFAVAEGEILGLIGPNGAGKTTAINLLSGVIKPNAGRVVFAGEEVTGLPPHHLARKGLVRTFQSTVVYGHRTVRENALRGAFLGLYPGVVPAFLGTLRARARRRETEDRIAELLAWFGLDHLGEAIAGSLPYGRQKSLGMVIALAARPRLLMLDEPVAGLAAEEADQVLETIRRIRQRGVTLIVVDHNMRFISGLCDRLVVLHHGQELAQGTPQQVLADSAVIAAYLGRGHGAA